MSTTTYAARQDALEAALLAEGIAATVKLFLGSAHVILPDDDKPSYMGRSLIYGVMRAHGYAASIYTQQQWYGVDFDGDEERGRQLAEGACGVSGATVKAWGAREAAAAEARLGEGESTTGESNE